MAIIIKILGLLLLPYVGFCLILYLRQESMIFFPTGLQDETFIEEFQPQKVSFQHEDVQLHGWWVQRELLPGAPLIIYYGGNAEEVSGELHELEQLAPASYLFVNYRGYGNSTGIPSEKALVQDALFILDEMIRLANIKTDQVILMGRSLGTGVAIQVAHQRTVRAVILVSPYDSIRDMAHSMYPIFPVKWLLKHPFHSKRYARDIRCPALILAGTADEVVPAECSEALSRIWGGPMTYKLLPNAHHNNMCMIPEYYRSIAQFLSDLDGQSADNDQEDDEA